MSDAIQPRTAHRGDHSAPVPPGLRRSPASARSSPRAGRRAVAGRRRPPPAARRRHRTPRRPSAGRPRRRVRRRRRPPTERGERELGAATWTSMDLDRLHRRRQGQEVHPSLEQFTQETASRSTTRSRSTATRSSSPHRSRARSGRTADRLGPGRDDRLDGRPAHPAGWLEKITPATSRTSRPTCSTSTRIASWDPGNKYHGTVAVGHDRDRLRQEQDRRTDQPRRLVRPEVGGQGRPT